MATEKTISSAAISLENFTTASSASVLEETFADNANSSSNSFTQQALYPRSNLSKAQRSKTWRSADTGTRAHCAVAMDLGSGKVPGVLAIVDSNLSYAYGAVLSGDSSTLTVKPNNSTISASQIMLQASNSSNFATSVDFTYSTYDQDPDNKVLRFYLENDNSSNSMSAFGYRYWRLVLHKSSAAETYFEIGQLYLGAVTEIAPEIGSLQYKQKDPSRVSSSYSGARYSDKLKPVRTINFSIKHIEDSAEAIPLQKIAASAGGVSQGILDISAWSTDAVRKASDVYYGALAQSGFNWKAQFQRRRTVSFSFVEAK